MSNTQGNSQKHNDQERFLFEAAYSGEYGTPVSVLRLLREGDAYIEKPSHSDRLNSSWWMWKQARAQLPAGGAVPEGWLISPHGENAMRVSRVSFGSVCFSEDEEDGRMSVLVEFLRSVQSAAPHPVSGEQKADSGDSFYAGLYRKSSPMWHRLHDLAVSKGYDHVQFAIECAPVYKCDCMGSRKVAIGLSGKTIPCECVAASNDITPPAAQDVSGLCELIDDVCEWFELRGLHELNIYKALKSAHRAKAQQGGQHEP